MNRFLGNWLSCHHSAYHLKDHSTSLPSNNEKSLSRQEIYRFMQPIDSLVAITQDTEKEWKGKENQLWYCSHNEKEQSRVDASPLVWSQHSNSTVFGGDKSNWMIQRWQGHPQFNFIILFNITYLEDPFGLKYIEPKQPL